MGPTVTSNSGTPIPAVVSPSIEVTATVLYNIVINPTVGLAASASNDATARLWDVQTGEEIAVFNAQGGSVWSVAFSPDGRLIATGSEDGDIHVYACGICARDDVLMATAKRRLKNLPPFREAGRIP